MTKTSTNTYKATITLKTGGGTGTVQFKVDGTDTAGSASGPGSVPDPLTDPADAAGD